MALGYRVCANLYLRRAARTSNKPSGQIKLQQAAVAVVGAGGLGCPAVQYLAAAGVGMIMLVDLLLLLTLVTGRIGIIDHDTVELSNLHRQILHTEQTVGLPKAESAAQACRKSIPFLSLQYVPLTAMKEQFLSGCRSNR